MMCVFMIVLFCCIGVGCFGVGFVVAVVDVVLFFSCKALCEACLLIAYLVFNSGSNDLEVKALAQMTLRAFALMFVAWLGGMAGRYRDRRGGRQQFLNSVDHSFLQHKLVDLAEVHDGADAPGLERLLHNMHADLGGKILALVLLQIHTCSNKVLQYQHAEQRVGCFCQVCGLSCLHLEDLCARRAGCANGCHIPWTNISEIHCIRAHPRMC
jgi:hypothetical protein